MLSITFETSERSDGLNWVKEAILNRNLDLLTFEGYTLKNSKVSLLLDRGLFSFDCLSIEPDELFDSLQNISEFHLSSKVSFSVQLGCPFLFFCYSYINQNCTLFEVSENKVHLIEKFSSFENFAKWTLNYRDLSMKSRFEESGLPQIDKVFRSFGIPWPGNLDYALLKEKTPTALIEFQRTVKKTVREHCNNTWFLPTRFRKGDVNRWLAIDIIRKQSGLPLFIIVWSSSEKEIKLKLVEKIIYPEDSDPVKGLRYKKKEVIAIDRLFEILNKY